MNAFRVLKYACFHATQGTVVAWWRAAFRGGAEIDVDKLADRKGAADRTAKFREAWDEAQRMFARKMAEKGDDRVEVHANFLH